MYTFTTLMSTTGKKKTPQTLGQERYSSVQALYSSCLLQTREVEPNESGKKDSSFDIFYRNKDQTRKVCRIMFSL